MPEVTTAEEWGKDIPPQNERQRVNIPGVVVAKPRELALRNIKILLYGRPGSGKTFLAGTAEDDPRMQDVIVADMEGGVLTLHNRGQHLDVVRIQNASEFSALYEFLYSEPHQYRTLVIDSLTEFQKMIMSSIMEAVTAGKPDRDPDLPSLQDWGKCAEQVRRAVRWLRDLPMHLIVTTLEQEIRDERDGTLTVKPSLPGKLADEIPAFFDIVGRVYTAVEGKPGSQTLARRLMVQPTGKYVAKDRSQRLPSDIENPSLATLLQAVWEE